MAARAPTQVQLPQPSADRPSWVRVGAVAVLGFAVGIAWPRLAGVRLGPSAPGESAASAEAPAASAKVAASASASAAPVVASAVVAAPSGAPSAAAAPAPAAGVMTVARGNVVSCKTEAGEARKGKDCGRVVGFDAIAHSRIKKLAALPAAQGNEGKLSVVVTLDFPSNRVIFVDVGKSSTVKTPEAFKAALVSQFQGVTLAAVEHEQPRVTLSFAASLAPAGAAPADAAVVATPASASDDGSASIVWDVAIVRDAPHTGSVVGRLPRGTKVQLGESKAGWYRIKFGAGFSTEGWLYRAAVGK